jgi:SpoIVB peptidase S55
MPLRSLVALVALGAVAAAAPNAASTGTASSDAPASAAVASAHRQAILPLSEVHVGMKGYGLTVFQGTKPERFDVRVLGVLHNFLPKQDIILIQSDDPRLLHSGIVAGMSGSPIYLDGKLVGALAYGWHFAKDPIAGVTPIETMLEEAKRPLRGPQLSPMAEARSDARARRTLDDVIASRDTPLAARFALPPALPREAGGGGESRLQRASVPLSLAGFGADAFAELERAFAPYHVTPLAAGGAAKPGAKGPSAFEAGGSIAVQLIRGDVSMAATGTVTHVDGARVLAFGHPMFNVGEIYLPIATAEIHTFLSSLSSSFKMASPLKEVGSLLQDRQSGILGDTSRHADMIPVTVTVGGPGRAEHSFRADVVRHRFLTPLLSATVISNASQTAASDVADATITVRSRLDVRGYKTLELTDHLYSPDGVSARTLASATGIKAIGDILFNPFAPANLDRIDIHVDVEYKADVAEIVGVSLNSDELEPGSRPSLYVTMRPYAGAEYTQTIPFDVPRTLAGQQVKIVATAGNLAKPEVAPPETLSNLLDNLRKSYPARSIVVSLETPDEGVTLRGAVIPDLPGSVIDTLRPGASTRRADTFKRAARFVVPMHGVVQGKQEITVRVKDDQNL